MASPKLIIPHLCGHYPAKTSTLAGPASWLSSLMKAAQSKPDCRLNQELAPYIPFLGTQCLKDAYLS
jgi:hypothetical protein